MTTLNADWMKTIGDFTLLIVVIFVRSKSNKNNVLGILVVVRFAVVIRRILSKSVWLVAQSESSWTLALYLLLSIAHLAYFVPVQKSGTCEEIH